MNKQLILARKDYMTRQRIDNHSTEFGIWLRKQKTIDSSLGFTATNIDYVWRNYKTDQWMLIEEKRYGSSLSFVQKEIFRIIDFVCRKDSNYCGFHKIIFEKTSPEDGKIFLDNMEISKDFLLSFLKFEK